MKALRIASRSDRKSKIVLLGEIRNITSKEAQLVVQKYRPVHDGRLSIKWMPVFVAEGKEVMGSGGKPTEESVHYDNELDVVVLHKGVLNSAASRKLDAMGFSLEESPTPGEEEEWERFPLDKDFEEEVQPRLAAQCRAWSPVHSF